MFSKRVRIIQIVGLILVFVYLGLFVSNLVFGYMGSLDTFIFSIILVAIGFDLIYKGVLLKSSSTLWFANSLILFAILIIILKLEKQNLLDFVYLFALIPVLPSILNLAVFKNTIYIKIIILNLSIFIPILIQFVFSPKFWLMLIIWLFSVTLGIIICRNLKFGKEKV
ncbi:MAG TPA: hypothetical protein DD614_00015 [Clostridiales bacterium]|nr:hypothetical protein [Clostridiales bacterium]